MAMHPLTMTSTLVEGACPHLLTAWRRVLTLRDRLAERYVPELMVIGLAAISVGLGFVLMALPHRFVGLATYRLAFEFPAWGWALLWAMLGVWVAVGGISRRSLAIAPALLLAIVYGAFSTLCCLAVATQGVPFAVLTMAGFSWWGLVIAIACSSPRRAR